jgi:hypothetical protein
MWLLTGAGRRVTIGDSLGVRYLATLLSNPGAEISVLDLAQQQPPGRTAADPADQELLDEDAKRAYRQRITELRQQIDEAESGSDPIRAEAARSELDWLLTEFGHATGLAGRSRAFPTDAERARSSVQKAIRCALVRIGRTDPENARTSRPPSSPASAAHTGRPQPGTRPLSLAEPVAPRARRNPRTRQAPATSRCSPHRHDMSHPGTTGHALWVITASSTGKTRRPKPKLRLVGRVISGLAWCLPDGAGWRSDRKIV